MKFKSKHQSDHFQKQEAIDTIIVIGNGFDRWQGLNTGYSQFHKYYLENRDKILQNLHIKKHIFIDQYGEKIECSDVELVYGNPFHPKELPNDFWNTFEASLAEIDADLLNFFFGKEKNELREMRRSIRNAKRILTEAFCGWIASINVEPKETDYSFGNNCLFINFNYTDTLIKRFGIKDTKEFHIHGDATDKKSIIFGHSEHPQSPEPMLARFGGRFEGLYYVDNILYETDKHCHENIQTLCMFLALSGAICENIKHVYVLGHSMGPADLEYFDFLVRSTQVACTRTETAESLEASDPLDELHNRLQYCIETVGNHNDNIEEAYTGAMLRKLDSERAQTNAWYVKEFTKIIGWKTRKANTQSNPQLMERFQDATWHISYHSDQDKQWIEAVMHELNCQNFELLPSIDECLASFRKRAK